MAPVTPSLIFAYFLTFGGTGGAEGPGGGAGEVEGGVGGGGGGVEGPGGAVEGKIRREIPLISLPSPLPPSLSPPSCFGERENGSVICPPPPPSPPSPSSVVSQAIVGGEEGGMKKKKEDKEEEEENEKKEEEENEKTKKMEDLEERKTGHQNRTRFCNTPDYNKEEEEEEEEEEDHPNHHYHNATSTTADHHNQDRPRKRRYTLQGNKWGKKELRWTLRKASRGTKHMSEGTIRQQLQEAVDLWAGASALKFIEVHPQDKNVDIYVSFEEGDHGCGYKFDGPGGTLAHAFYPGPGKGGDVHFDAAEEFVAHLERKKTGKSSFLVTAAHELGHSLGIMHSDVASALMVPFYQDFPDVFPLPEDDVRAIRVLYGPPDHAATLPPPPPPPPTTTTTTTTRRPPPPPRPRPTTTRRPPPPPRTWPTRPPHPRPQPTTLPPPRPPRPPHTRPPPRTTSTTPPPPRRGACPLPRPPPGRDAAESPCSPLPFDAATQYRGELFFFRGAHYWRLGRGAATHPYEYPGTIVRRFPPLRRVDAAYVSAARRLVLFQGAEFFELGGDLRVARRGGLAELGVDAPRLDAAMVWGHNGRVYLFSGHRYWRLGPDGTAERDYPRHTAVWRGVPANLSAALTQGTHTYFLAGAVFWEFDSFAMRVTQQPLLAAPHWLACPAAVSPRKLVQCSGGRRARLHALLLLMMMMMPMLHPRAAP